MHEMERPARQRRITAEDRIQRLFQHDYPQAEFLRAARGGGTGQAAADNHKIGVVNPLHHPVP